MNLITKSLSILVSATLFSGLLLRAQEAPDYSDYEKLLETYVTEDGVCYAAWSENEDDVTVLNAFVEHLGQVDFNALPEAEQIAFYINLYNAAMLKIVLENYPIESVTKIGILPFSVFKKDQIQLGDGKVSLDEIEKGILLNKYFDPRIHFAVNCASESCPPLRTEPFTGSQLEEQLKEQTELFAESKRAVRIDEANRNIAYSELFKWYADDFEVKNPAEYLNQFRSEALPKNYSVEWIPYDWSLNEIEKDK